VEEDPEFGRHPECLSQSDAVHSLVRRNAVTASAPEPRAMRCTSPFDQTVGDLFVCRVAGNIVNSEIIGSLEYGAAVLGVKVLVVMGHANRSLGQGEFRTADREVAGHRNDSCSPISNLPASQPDPPQPPSCP
jgi:hypothetical protein